MARVGWVFGAGLRAWAYEWEHCSAESPGGGKPVRLPRALLRLRFLLTGVAAGSPTGHDCVICQDPIHGAEIRAPCGHYYDIACITDLFQSATRDESLFPPRCCRLNIPLAQVQSHLTQTLITTFQQKQAELSTLKRVYCSSSWDPSRKASLGPKYIPVPHQGVAGARVANVASNTVVTGRTPAVSTPAPTPPKSSSLAVPLAGPATPAVRN